MPSPVLCAEALANLNSYPKKMAVVLFQFSITHVLERFFLDFALHVS